MVRKAKDLSLVSADPPELEIRAGSSSDVEFVKELSIEVFSQFGEYGTFLPMYLTHPSVYTAIGKSGGMPIGFVMLALVSSDRPLPGDRSDAHEDPAKEWLDAEILAIAVRPDHQTRKVGTRLMAHVMNSAEGWLRTTGIRSIQLNVAETNDRALTFFTKTGFIVVDDEDGFYPQGQRSIRMAYPF